LIDTKTAIKNLVTPRVAPANLAPVKIPDTPPKTYRETLERAELIYGEDFKKLDEAIKVFNDDPVSKELNLAISKADRNLRKWAGDMKKYDDWLELDMLKSQLFDELQDHQEKLKESLLEGFEALRNKMISRGDEALAVSKVGSVKIPKGLPHERSLSWEGGDFYRDNLRDLYQISNNRVDTLEELLARDKRAWAANKGVLYDGETETTGRINVGIKDTSRAQKTTLWHEFGHHVEYSIPEAQDIAHGFIAAKSTSSTPVRLSQLTGNPNFGDDEVAFPGDFLSPYVGKIYDDGSTEVISMGLQQFADLDDMLQFYQNHPDHFKLILGIL
jgi:hypothetical protein